MFFELEDVGIEHRGVGPLDFGTDRGGSGGEDPRLRVLF